MSDIFLTLVALKASNMRYQHGASRLAAIRVAFTELRPPQLVGPRAYVMSRDRSCSALVLIRTNGTRIHIAHLELLDIIFLRQLSEIQASIPPI